MKKERTDIIDLVKRGMERYLGNRGLSMSTANKKQRGKAFAEYYVRDIANYLYKLDEDFIADGLRCDGKNDLNIDFVYQSDDIYYVMQSKYKSKGSLTRDEISGFMNIHTRILDKEYLNENGNDEVKDLLATFSKSSQVNYVLITSVPISEDMWKEFKLQTDKAKEMFGSKLITWVIKGISEIKSDFKTAQSIDEPIPDAIDIPIEQVKSAFSYDKQPALLDLTSILDEDTYETYLCTIKGTVLKNLYVNNKAKLFNYNIRGYLGQNVINKRITNTIETEPKSFYLYNNGISAICTDLEPVKDEGSGGMKLKIKNFQIINGAQTACCIGEFKDSNKLKDVRVLLKVTRTARIKKETKELNRKIIMNNNSQTVIKASDFRSNDDIQYFLESKFPNYVYKARTPYKKLIYLPKRRKISKSNEEEYITMETLAKILYSFRNAPNLIYANTKFLFDVDSINAGKYWDIFGTDGEEAAIWTEDQVKEVIAIVMLWLYILEKLKLKEKELILEGKENTVDYQACLAKWHYLWAYGDLIRRFYPERMNWIINRIISGRIFEKESQPNFIDTWYEEISIRMLEALDSEYLDSQKSDEYDDIIRKGFNFKNWLRSEEAFKKLRLKFKRASEHQFPLA